MITRSRLVALVLVGLVPFSSIGCIVIGGSGCGWSCCDLKVSTEPVTERISLDTAGMDGMDVRTHNGRVTFEALPSGSGDAVVTVTKKGRGRTLAEAEAALEAIEAFVESPGDGVLHIGWRWKGLKPMHWGATVSFDIQAPGDIKLVSRTHNGSIDVTGVKRGIRLETHNGSIEANHIAGEVRIETHNGPVAVTASGGSLYGKTHNGGVDVTYDGGEATLITHNGRIVADMSRCAALGGTMTTHNGSITVVVGDAASTRLTARTHNGGISCDAPLSGGQYTKHKLTGTIGAGEGALDLTTHNGSVRIEKSAG